MASSHAPDLLHGIAAKVSESALSGTGHCFIPPRCSSIPQVKRKGYPAAASSHCRGRKGWCATDSKLTMTRDQLELPVHSESSATYRAGKWRRGSGHRRTGICKGHAINPKHSEVEIRLAGGGLDTWKRDYVDEVVMLTPEEIVTLETLLRGGIERRRKCIDGGKYAQLEEEEYCNEQSPKLYAGMANGEGMTYVNGTLGDQLRSEGEAYSVNLSPWFLNSRAVSGALAAEQQQRARETLPAGIISQDRTAESSASFSPLTKTSGERNQEESPHGRLSAAQLEEDSAIMVEKRVGILDEEAAVGTSGYGGREREEEERGGGTTGETERWREPEVCRVGEAEGMGVVLHQSLFQEVWSRGRWLLGLLVLQSSSGVVLQSYQDLIREHLVITLFLTMLVGAGGNAGNQSAIKVIRELATGEVELSSASLLACLKEQVMVGALLAVALATLGFVRVYATNGDLMNSIAIASSLFLIVLTSVGVGTALPFALAWRGVDPANAGTSVQVIMDLVGVGITCSICGLIFSAPAKLPLHATLAALQESASAVAVAAAAVN